MQVEDCCQALLAQILPTIDEQREGICIDIGVGTFAFYCEVFAKLGFETVAVEPLPIDVLRQLCSRHQINLVEACVSEISGSQTLHIGTFKGSENVNLSSLESDWWGSSTKTVEVESLTLSQVLSRVNAEKVTCIKIDVEGAESRIIKQFRSLPESLLPDVVMFEYGGGDRKEGGQKGWSEKFASATYECLEILKDSGYASSVIIDSAKDAKEIIFNLQSSNLDTRQIFPEVSVYGNIIAIKGNAVESLKIDDILEICAQYKYEAINRVSSKKLPDKTKEIGNENINKKQQENFKATGEKSIIDRLIQSQDIVFDVGANIGSWTQAVLNYHSDVKIHLFEPVPQTYQILLRSISDLLKTGNIFPNNLAISSVEKLQEFYFYEEQPTWSTFFRRFDVEKQYGIKPPQLFQVLATTLDLYCQRWGIERINLLKIDVEGGELDVLHGCENLLKKGNIDYIQFEYGGNFIDANITLKEVFEYLQSHNYSIFKILSNGLEYKPNFKPQDEDYKFTNFLAVSENVKSYILGETSRKITIPARTDEAKLTEDDKSVTTMSTLGINGRFANQLFQYAFLKIYAKENDLEVETPAWIGQFLFGCEEPSISKQLPVVRETSNDLATAIVPNTKQQFKNVDFWGYFQYNTKYYAPHKDYFRSLFRPVPEIEKKLQVALQDLRSKGNTLVGIHLRRGDYGYAYYFVPPNEWYKKWLSGLWESLDRPVLFIASDEIEQVVGDFAEYNPITVNDLGVDLPQAEFYPDFYLLSKCDVVAISNSSFSFAACMLNENGKLFYRPHLPSRNLITFDPWSSETILRDARIEEYGVVSNAESSVEIFAEPKPKATPSENKEITTVRKESSSSSINVLVSFLAPKKMYREIIISPREVFCGPNCETELDGEEYLTIKTPLQNYDIAAIVERLPQSQKPDLLVVKADATKRNLPINLQKIQCPKLLICGNTQHFPAPIKTVLEYAQQQGFDFIMSDHKRHHLHYFKEAGFENVFWVPAFNINPRRQPANIAIKYPLSFVGQARRYHPYRKYVLGEVKKSGLPLESFLESPEKTAQIYAESQINLNISLNGDLNLRVFEVLASGGFLLTDRLSEQSGLELLFEDGKHLGTFRNDSELKHKIAFFLENPEVCREIASNGSERFWQNHRPEVNIKRVLDYIGGRNIDPIYKIEAEKRSIYVTSKNSAELRDRISIYEYLQELHLNQPADIRGLFWPKVDYRIICDAVDLPRLKLHLICDPNISISNKLLLKCDIADQITFRSYPTPNKREGWELIALTWSELQSLGIDELLNLLDLKWLVVTDFPNGSSEEKQEFDEVLERRGLIKKSDLPLVYYWQRKADWGKLLLSRKQFQKALRAFEEALEDNPHDISALLELSMLSLHFNNLGEAERLARQAVSLERRNYLVMERLARVLIVKEKYQEAKEILESLLAIAADDVSLWLLLENCYYQLGLERKSLEAGPYIRALERGQKIEKIGISQPEIATTKTKAKRILVINNLYPPQELGGYGRSLFDFTNVLKKRGHTIFVLTSNAPYLEEIKALEPDVNRNLILLGTYEGGTRRIENPEIISKIVAHNDAIFRNVVDSFLPDVCLIGNIDFLGPAIFNPFLEKNIPIVNHLGFTSLRYPPQQTPASPLYRMAAASNYVRENILKQGYPHNNIPIVYPGALVKNFEMCVLPNADKLRLVYAGLLISSKGTHTLIEALKILDQRNIDFECSLAGDSIDQEYVNSLKNFVGLQGIDHKVKFLGYLQREQLIDLYSTHNVLVFPSIHEEAFGISQVEGMAAGLTLVTTGVGGAGEVIEDKISGLIFPPEDANALADLLEGLTQNKDNWREVAAEGQKRAMKLFDVDRSVDILEKQFDELIEVKEEVLWYQRQLSLKENLRLRDINLIIFPDWSQLEESLPLELQKLIVAIASHPDRSQINLLVDNNNFADEEADLTLSSIVMNLMMEEDLDVEDGPEIALTGNLNIGDWSCLMPLVDAKIVMENENSNVFQEASIEGLQELEIENLTRLRAIQLENDKWQLFPLGEINLIIFPDWRKPEESLYVELQKVIAAIASHPEQSKIALLIDNSNISDDEANLILSGITMNLLMEEGLELNEGLDISLIGKQNMIKWDTLVPHLCCRIKLENENEEAIVRVKADNIPSIELDSLPDQIQSFQTQR